MQRRRVTPDRYSVGAKAPKSVDGHISLVFGPLVKRIHLPVGCGLAQGQGSESMWWNKPSDEISLEGKVHQSV